MSRPTTPSELEFPLAPDDHVPELPEVGARGAPALRLVPPRPRVRPDTTPLPAPASTFETRRLVAIGGERLELVPTWQERTFLGVFVGFAVALGAIGASRFGAAPAAVGETLAAVAPLPPAWPPILAGATLALIAALIARAGKRTVLDGRTRQFRRGSGAPRLGGASSDASSSKPDGEPIDAGSAASRGAGRRRLDHIGFDDLVGVQHLACHIADEEARWTVHQVNLVLRDGTRVHVCSHVEERLARRTAETIARFIGVDMLSSVSGTATGDDG